MSCCNLWSAGEPCDCHIPSKRCPGEGYEWDKLNQEWVKAFLFTCQAPWKCTPSNCTCGPFDLPMRELTKDEHKQEVMIEDAENTAALKLRIKGLEEQLAEALAKLSHRDHTH